MQPPRIIHLEGGFNFRDAGGYDTRDGRRVPWGRLFRSGALAGLTGDAVLAVQALGVRSVCDLRRTAERLAHPNPEFGPGVRCFAWETTTEVSPIRDPRFARSATVGDAQRAMLGMYERLPFVLQPRLKGAFEAMDHAADGAVIIHCSAGKDRTGLAVALVLEALGVARESIVEDYVLTGAAVDLREKLLGTVATGLGIAATAEPLLALSPHALDAVLDARPEYITASFDSIEARHGTVADYLRDELHIDPALLERLRTRLLD